MTSKKNIEVLKGLWGHYSFRQLWIGQTISVLGSQISYIAIPLIAVILLDANAFQMGLLTASSTAPYFLIGLFAGVWIDRIKRVPILINMNLITAFFLLLIPLFNWLNVMNIWILCAISFFTASCSMVFQFAYTSVLPSIINKNDLTEGNSKLEISRAMTQFVGPSIAGVIIHVLSAPISLFINIITYLVSIFFFKRINIDEKEPTTTKNTILKQIRQGFHHIFTNPFLRTISLSTAILNFSRCAFDAVYMLYVVTVFSIDASILGIIFGVGSLGALLGAFTANKLVKKIGTGNTILISTVIVGVGFLIVAIVTKYIIVNIAILSISQFFISMGNTVFFISQVSIRQAVTPNEIMGRVNATQVFISRGAVPIGALLGGLSGMLFGLRETIMAAGCLSLGAVFLLVMSPVKGVRQTSDIEI
ncbi:MFS transporter [Paenibacillus alvei]|uniref:MFS transporter n=1 Tax=Paenibacillus alvei TaxID=44250 RepID=A0ABT4E851_PAEAL|nr:MFS transporter [Paenibacillus alvei]MCY9529916.1 MFS transporter [Paenibacillus alvei]